MKTSIVLTMIHDIVHAAIELGLDPEQETEMMRKTIDAYALAQNKELEGRRSDEHTINQLNRTPKD